MKILYYSDNYAHEVMGTKRSIEEEVHNIGHVVYRRDKSQIGKIIVEIKKTCADQVWLVHSSLTIPLTIKSKIKIPIIGFGFSDPYYFNQSRFDSYDKYVTNHYSTFLEYNHRIPIHYNPTACDFRFHKKMDVDKIKDITVIGRGSHPRFHNKYDRIAYVGALRDYHWKLTIDAYGIDWPEHLRNFPPIDGIKFLTVINQSRIGLDIQDDWSPLAHRMFEYIACGTPVITREREEVHRVFKVGEEILTYTDFKDLRDRLEYYLLEHNNELLQVAEAGRKRCLRDHDIKNRVDKLLTFLEN